MMLNVAHDLLKMSGAIEESRLVVLHSTVDQPCAFLTFSLPQHRGTVLDHKARINEDREKIHKAVDALAKTLDDVYKEIESNLSNKNKASDLCKQCASEVEALAYMILQEVRSPIADVMNKQGLFDFVVVNFDVTRHSQWIQPNSKEFDEYRDGLMIPASGFRCYRHSDWKSGDESILYFDISEFASEEEAFIEAISCTMSITGHQTALNSWFQVPGNCGTRALIFKAEGVNIANERREAGGFHNNDLNKYFTLARSMKDPVESKIDADDCNWFALSETYYQRYFKRHPTWKDIEPATTVEVDDVKLAAFYSDMDNKPGMEPTLVEA